MFPPVKRSACRWSRFRNGGSMRRSSRSRSSSAVFFLATSRLRTGDRVVAIRTPSRVYRTIRPYSIGQASVHTTDDGRKKAGIFPKIDLTPADAVRTLYLDRRTPRTGETNADHPDRANPARDLHGLRPHRPQAGPPVQPLRPAPRPHPLRSPAHVCHETPP